METARALGELLKTGMAAEAHDHLRVVGRRGAGAARLDRVGREAHRRSSRQGRRLHQQRRHGQGWLNVDGSHSLQAFVERPGARRQRSRSGTARRCLEAKRDARDQRRRRPTTRRRTLQHGMTFRIAALGSGSDYTAFLDHLTIASMNLGFGGEAPSGGVYHSTYDSLLLVHPFRGHRLHVRRGALADDRHGAACGWRTPTSCRSSSPRPRRRCAATWTRSRSCARHQGRAGARFLAAEDGDRSPVARGRRLRHGVRAAQYVGRRRSPGRSRSS